MFFFTNIFMVLSGLLYTDVPLKNYLINNYKSFMALEKSWQKVVSTHVGIYEPSNETVLHTEGVF